MMVVVSLVVVFAMASFLDCGRNRSHSRNRCLGIQRKCLHDLGRGICSMYLDRRFLVLCWCKRCSLVVVYEVYLFAVVRLMEVVVVLRVLVLL